MTWMDRATRSMVCAMVVACGKTAAPSAAVTPAATSTPTVEPATSAPWHATGAAGLVVKPAGDIAVGAAPPDFSAKAHDGTPVTLSGLRGKSVVVYFYPRDETPGCTTEACAFRDAWTALDKAGVVLIGVSTDSDDSHRAFAAHHKLPFLLVSDPAGELAKAFGVPVNGAYIGRQSFVIGKDGNVKKVYRTVDVKVHAGQIADDVR